MKEIKFDIEKIKCGMFINPEIIKIENYDSFITNTFLLELKAFVATQQKQEKEIILNRPTFIEWLFRKQRKVRVSSKDVLLNPPQIIPGQNTIRFYNFNIVEPTK